MFQRCREHPGLEGGLQADQTYSSESVTVTMQTLPASEELIFMFLNLVTVCFEPFRKRRVPRVGLIWTEWRGMTLLRDSLLPPIFQAGHGQILRTGWSASCPVG